MALWQNGAISHETLLQSLKRGEVLPQIDVEAEIEMTQQEKLDSMAMAMPVGDPAVPGEEGNSEPSEMRAMMEERVRQLNGNEDQEEEE